MTGPIVYRVTRVPDGTYPPSLAGPLLYRLSVHGPGSGDFEVWPGLTWRWARMQATAAGLLRSTAEGLIAEANARPGWTVTLRLDPPEED